MATATEGTLMKILKELQGIRSDLSLRDTENARAEQAEMLAGMGMMHPPIPLRPDDIRREGPPQVEGLRNDILVRLHEADAEAREHLPEPRPGHTWRVDLETSCTLTSTGRGDFATALRLVYTQVRL